MMRLGCLLLAIAASLLLASSALAQQNEGDIKLSAREIYAQLAPASTASTLIPFHVEVNGRDDDAFNVTVSNTGAVISLILPNGTEITETNAASFSYGWEVYAPDSDAVTSGLFITPFSRTGTNTLIALPPTAPAGTYQIKINTTGVSTNTVVSAAYLTASPLKFGLLSDKPSYTSGLPVVLSAFAFNGTTPITNATVEAFVMDNDHPEVTPVQVTFADSGPDDAEPGDGIYTGVYTASTTGKFTASMRATGNSAGGFPYVRMTSTEFRVLPSLATFTSFSDAGVDDNGNSLFDRIVVTANLQVQQAGNFRLGLTLVASNGQIAEAFSTATLATGAQQMTVPFTATQIAELGVNGPYTIKNATLYYTTDPEEPIAAFSEDGGQTTAYTLASLERAVVKFTGNNTVSGIDTNSNTKFDILRIQVELNLLAAATYNWSGTLKDSNGRDIQVIDGITSMSTGNNTLTFDFDGIKIAQNGVDGPYSLSSVLLFNDQIAIHEPELLKTQAFPITAFECSDAPAATVQSASLAPTSLIGGNATTLHVTLAEAAGACGAKVTISANNPAVIAAAIPDTIIVPSGQTSADFTVITSGVSTATTVDLTATSGVSSQTATLTITPSSLSNMTLSFTAVQAGNGSGGKVELDGAAPLGDLTVSLSSSNAGVASVPATVVIPAGLRSALFTVDTNASFTGSTTVDITATLGSVTKVASLAVYSETYINGTITPGGPPVTVTATLPGQNFLLTFDGTASQRVSVKMTDVNFNDDSCCGARISIKKPDGTYLVNPVYFGTSGGFVDATILPVAGTYTIVVDPTGSNTGHATLTLYDVPADFTTTITPGGAAVTATTTVPGQNAQLTFSGTAGQRVSLKATNVSMSGNGYVEIGIKNPDGSVLASVNFVTSSGTFIDVQTLATAGTYTVFVNPIDSSTGSVTLTLYNVPADVTGNMTVGTPFTATTTVPGQNALLSFNGTSGQRVTVNIGGVTMSGGSGYVDVALRKPDGTTLATSNFVTSGGAFINTQTLPATGVYTLLVNPKDSNTGSVTLTVNDVSADVLGSIVIAGNAVTVTTTSAGQNALVSFDGTAGQRVSLKISGVSLTGGNGYVDVSIKKPDGTVLASSTFITSSGGFIDVRTLPVTGTYTILVDPQGSNIGSVTLTLYEVPADTTGTITPGGAAVTITTTVPGQNATLTFDGTAGQRVALVLTSSTYSGCLAVNSAIKKPDGTNLVNTNLCSASGFIDTVVLPVTGTYTILVDPFGDRIGSQTLTLINVPANVETSITPGGSPVTVSTTTAGQKALATFSGTANQRVSLKVSNATITGGTQNYISVAILKPDGSSLTTATLDSSGGFVDVQTLPVNGTYTVSVDPWDTATATVTLTLYDVPADNSVSITPGGGSVTLSNTVPGQNALATFTATANQRVSLNINSISLSGGDHNWVTISIKAPNGSNLVSGTYATGNTAYIDTLVLATAGTYTILINQWDTATGSVTFTLNDVPADATGTLTMGGPPLTLTTTVPGQNAMPIFSGTSGQQVSVAFTSNGMGNVTVTLLKPDGTSQTSTTSSAASFNLVTQTLATTGTYSIKIDPSGANVGSITVAVNEVISGGTLVADYQFQNTLNTSAGSAAALTNLGTNSYTSAVVDGTARTVLSFTQGNGVSLSPTSGVVPNDSYTIVMLCSLTTTSSYRRLVDFKNAASDTGLYQQSGKLNFYPSAVAPSVSIAANAWVQVVITRDATGTVTGYVDGVQQLQFSDTASNGVISGNTLRFFRDNSGTTEASAGSVARIRLYNGALSASQVSALDRLP